MRKLFWMILFPLMALGTTVSAQSRGGYFFGNSLLRSKLNPAFAPTTDYASLPGAGSLSVDMASNVGLEHFIFPDNGTGRLFLEDAVPAGTFLAKLPARDPYLRERVESDLFGYGMKMGKNGYATLSLSVVEDGDLVISNDLLRFAKAGSGATPASFEGGSGALSGYAALAAGYSLDLGSLAAGLRAGVRIKLLFGLAAGQFTVDRMGMQSGPDQISAAIHGTGTLAGVSYDADKGFSRAGAGSHANGAAIDLGASYRIPLDGPWALSGIELSASVCDLGGLTYRSGVSKLSMDHQFAFSGVGNLAGDVKVEFQQAIDDLMAFTEVDSSVGESFLHRLPASVHAGASASLWRDKANVGLLYYHAVGHDNLMASGGISPLPWLNLGVNWTFLGPASRFGCYAEFIPKKYLGVFIGTERASLRSNGSHIPIRNFTGSFAFGVNVLFGK